MSAYTSVTKDYVAIFDIGSNAVRLVVYDGLHRAPVKIHNERNVCNLGADLATTGRLNPEGIEKAIGSLRRFAGLVESMKIKHVRAVATAAVRDAKDGADFIARVKKELGVDIHVIDGEEEARLSALGVLANGLGKNGVIGDYGGGSLELIVVEDGRVKYKSSLPLGSHRLHVLKDRTARAKEIDAQLDTADFLQKYKGRDFYALGGAWRSMARAHMHMKNYPLHVLDHYTMDGAKSLEFASLLAKQSPVSLERTVGLSKKRIRDMSVAALTMERLFQVLHPQRLIFSGTGLREGLLYEQLPPAVKKQDALIASCKSVAMRMGRFDDEGFFETLYNWMAPVFKQFGDDVLRLIQASCYLSDMAGFDHEDYQADLAFQRVFAMPFYALDHPGRAFLAIAQYVRYKGYLRRAERSKSAEEMTRPAQRLLNEEQLDQAVAVGQALRVAYLLTGGALHLLKQTEFDVTSKKLVLNLETKAHALGADIIKDALQAMADPLKLVAAVRA